MQEDKNLEVEEGVALMMRQSFLQVPHAQELAQRKKLFRKRIKCKERVCNLLIDSRSTENLVSKEMVEKLELERIPHPYPYNFSWLTKEYQTLVTEKAMVEFSLGDFKDKVLCDIVEMDACHLLFGRPWQYDMDAMYNCRKNMYTIVRDGKLYNIKPLHEPKMEKEPLAIKVGEK